MRPMAELFDGDHVERELRPWPDKLDRAYDAADQRYYAVPTWQLSHVLWRADSPAERKQRHLDHFAGGAR